MNKVNIEVDYGGKTSLHYAAENSDLSVSINNSIREKRTIFNNKICFLDSKNFI